jgi:hypothetical protein
MISGAVNLPMSISLNELDPRDRGGTDAETDGNFLALHALFQKITHALDLVVCQTACVMTRLPVQRGMVAPRDQLQMRWIDAFPILAPVMHIHAVRNRAVFALECDSMSQSAFEYPIPVSVQRSRPTPTIGRLLGFVCENVRAVLVMVRQITDMFSADMAVMAASVFGNGGFFAAAAHAESRWIRRRNWVAILGSVAVSGAIHLARVMRLELVSARDTQLVLGSSKIFLCHLMTSNTGRWGGAMPAAVTAARRFFVPSDYTKSAVIQGVLS